MRRQRERLDLCEPTRTTESEGLLILHNNAGPLGTAASLHASNGTLAAIPNVTLLEAPWANGNGETDVCWPYPEIVDEYALPLEGPGLGIEADEASVDEELAASKALCALTPAAAEWAGWVGAGLLGHSDAGECISR